MHKKLFLQITSLENLYFSFNKFKKGKRGKPDIQLFERYLEDNLFLLHRQLKNKTYKHSSYTSFYINDPKRRHIHKATVRDRIVHHAIYRNLYPIFDKSFIYDSYSCRLNKGTHRAVDRLEKFVRIISQNYTQPCFALKCDIKKFFASIDHRILLNLIKRKIKDKNALWLVAEIIDSYHNCHSGLDPESINKIDSRFRGNDIIGREPKRGLPLGNLTSQLFANIYLDELDQFIKHKLKIKYYLRYCDDFVILDTDKNKLEKIIPQLSDFLQLNLKLTLHPSKIIIRKLKQGIDFLGYIILPRYRLLRTKTKRRIYLKLQLRINEYKRGLISGGTLSQSLNSYLGVLSHANTHELQKKFKNQFKIEF